MPAIMILAFLKRFKPNIDTPEQNPARLAVLEPAECCLTGIATGGRGRRDVARASRRDQSADLAGLGVKGFFGWLWDAAVSASSAWR